MKLNEKEKTELLERLSALEHEQWMSWTKHILENEKISEETKKRWKANFLPYQNLSEEVKQQDRPFAKKSLNVFEKFLEGK